MTVRPGLDRILWRKKLDLIRKKSLCPLSALQVQSRRMSAPRRFERAISGEPIRLIAEMKRASPSAGMLRPLYDVARGARAYERGGASALSVLTEENFFRGELTHILEAKRACGLPVLRKDFLFDPYQIYESRAWDADAILLIVAILSDWELKRLLSLATGLGMAALVEVHDKPELDRALSTGAKLIGVNSRNLKDLSMDPGVFRQLLPSIPKDRIIVAESGVKSAKEVAELDKLGASAVLVGEALLRQPDLEAAARHLLGNSR